MGFEIGWMSPFADEEEVLQMAVSYHGGDTICLIVYASRLEFHVPHHKARRLADWLERIVADLRKYQRSAQAAAQRRDDKAAFAMPAHEILQRLINQHRLNDERDSRYSMLHTDLSDVDSAVVQNVVSDFIDRLIGDGVVPLPAVEDLCRRYQQMENQR